jgi:hypothetical protein
MTNLHVVRPLECEVSSCTRFAVCNFMAVRISSVGTVGWSLFIFGIEGFIRHRPVSGEHEHSTVKKRYHSHGYQNKKI